MNITMTINGKVVSDDIKEDMLLLDFLRLHGCLSVRRGCDTSNCGCCTVLMDKKPILSCSVMALRASGHEIETMEGLRDEAAEFIDYFANQGADQCGFCNPGYIVNIIALLRENPRPTDEEILHHLTGNLCRCSGYQSHLRALRGYLDDKYPTEV